MACPKCGCKTTYLYGEGDDLPGGDERLYRCAACGAVFDIEDEAPADDDDNPPECDRGVELRVQEILASRRNANASGQSGQDISNIRAAIQAAGFSVMPDNKSSA
ncbi:hypothetical protein [Azonexus hydrophilus]|uniref:hypothetical protein n=1 Tax=Azonexus hydrophilus TaxID=418702 RepID=UPI002491D811|nr:hypothetical protein [Azonexus hydrophilus]